jgi:hypothetical protein
MSIKNTTVAKVQICAFCEEEKPIVSNGLCNVCNRVYERNGTKEHPDKFLKKCSLDDCDRPVIAQNMCDKHYRRWKRHGDTKQTRQKGWGSKEKHPLYQTWSWKKRTAISGFADEWKDFWQFVEDVGERPSPKHRFCVIDPSKPIYKDNYEWQEWKDGGAEQSRKTEYMKQWRKNNPAKVKNIDLKRRFGITLDDYNGMLEAQEFKCAICGHPETATNPRTNKAFDLSVDHDHETGVVRSLLCKNCNNMIGYAKDSIGHLTNAIDYLKKHASSEA